ncbi:MAG: hypothetical protein L0Y72_07635 [Gemmataceae bacterium]|nr:hypothetical protein [Gemmataceae bacterium]MCI0738900.1 hypothetical protein [Gemmataceae bacterium]
MTHSTMTINGILQPDGVTLQLDKKLDLPPGRVTVTVAAAARPKGLTMLEVLERIHRDQQQDGRTPMTDEEMAAEISQSRADDDE